MRVKMLTLSAGPDGVFPAGSIREVSDRVGAEMIAGRYAEMVEAGRVQPESATADPPEAAVLPSPRRRRMG